MRKDRFVELIQEEVQVLRTLIILKDIQRKKNKKLARRNLLQENPPIRN
jgi:hypothetical protein